jgi:phage baseplate assembly protein W
MTTPAHPYRVGRTRQLASVDAERHIADLVRVVLLTGPGERLHRPDFGAGLAAATVFEPLDDSLRAVVEVRARGSLERALGDRIEIVDVKVGIDGSALLADVVYRLRPSSADRRLTVDTGRTTP